MKNFTIQALINFQWLDIAELQILQPEKGAASLCKLEYDLNYAIQHLDKMDEYACSLSLPIHLLVKHESKKWFGFLDDIVPSGAARRYWLRYLGITPSKPCRTRYYLIGKRNDCSCRQFKN